MSTAKRPLTEKGAALTLAPWPLCQKTGLSMRLSAFLLTKMAVTGTGAALTLAPWVLFQQENF
jgi:hypothetical protein